MSQSASGGSAGAGSEAGARSSDQAGCGVGTGAATPGLLHAPLPPAAAPAAGGCGLPAADADADEALPDANTAGALAVSPAAVFSDAGVEASEPHSGSAAALGA